MPHVFGQRAPCPRLHSPFRRDKARVAGELLLPQDFATAMAARHHLRNVAIEPEVEVACKMRLPLDSFWRRRRNLFERQFQRGGQLLAEFSTYAPQFTRIGTLG